MDITLLDAVSPHPVGAAIRVALGDAVTRAHRLVEERFAPCQGCFECWVAHPGTCKASDDANTLMRDIAGADEVVWAARPVFGGWDGVAKRALDKTIGLVLPFFAQVGGETHHRSRYDQLPRMGVVAVVGADTPPSERDRFRLLVARNAVNLRSDAPWVAFVAPDASAEVVHAAVTAARALPPAPFPELAPFPARPGSRGIPVPSTGLPDAGPRRALLVVGSARPAGTSTSERLGRALLDRLDSRGWDTRVTHLAHRVRFARPEVGALAAELRAADLVVLATPVYFDALPALVTTALERLVGVQLGPTPPALLPLVQCGFPELVHTRLALEVLSSAADRLGLPWAGHLAVAGGGAFEGAALDRPSGMAWRQVQGLDLAASALDAGAPVPPEASDAFAKLPMSPTLYRIAGDLGWVARAWQAGAVLAMTDRPFARPDPG